MAIDLDSTFARAHAGRGEARLELRGPAEALGDYKKAVEWDPDYFRGLLEYGRLHAKKGMHQEAIMWYKRASEEKPYDRKLYEYWDEALAEIAKDGTALIGLIEDRRTAELARARAFARAGSCEEAEEWFDSAATLADRWSGAFVESNGARPSEQSGDGI